jgi:hypothetical protein
MKILDLLNANKSLKANNSLYPLLNWPNCFLQPIMTDGCMMLVYPASGTTALDYFARFYN